MNGRLKCLGTLLLAIALVPALEAQAVAPLAATPRVVVSIKPLHSLAAGVMAGVAEPEVLIKGGGSLHDYALRPSEARALSRANLVFWVGPVLETFMERPLAALAGKARVVAMIAMPGVKVQPSREGGLWEDGLRKDAGEPLRHGDGVDGHIWLDPGNAAAIVAGMAEALGAFDQSNAGRYRENAAAMQAKLSALDGELRAKLARVKEKPFVVFHDAYQYFEASYGLRAVGSITLSPDRAPGAGRVAEVKRKIAGLGPVCVFSEPQFQPRIVEMLIRGTAAKTGMLDPEGTTIGPGAELYFDVARGLAASLVACLTAGP